MRDEDLQQKMIPPFHTRTDGAVNLPPNKGMKAISRGKSAFFMLGCPRKLVSMVSKWVITLIYPIYK